MTTPQFTITAVQALPDATLLVSYADGEALHVRLGEVIRRHPTLAPLADPAVFATVQRNEWGDAVQWAGNDALELAADNLRARGIEQAGGYSHETIWNWMDKHGMTLDQAATALGLSRRMLAYYRSGQKPVPRTVALACLGWETEQQMAA